jgi:hypothetical protein
VCFDIVIQHNHSFGPWSITPFTTSIIQFENGRSAFWTYFKNVMTTSFVHCYQNIKHPAKFFRPKNEAAILVSNYQHPTSVLTQL